MSRKLMLIIQRRVIALRGGTGSDLVRNLEFNIAPVSRRQGWRDVDVDRRRIERHPVAQPYVRMIHLRGARPRPPEPSGPIVGHRLPMLDGLRWRARLRKRAAPGRRQ